MSCSKIIEMIYEDEEYSSLLSRIRISFHTLICTDCAEEKERYEASRAVMREDFFPFASGIENSVMSMIEAQEKISEDSYADNTAGVLSVRGWVIAGLVIFISLATAFFSLNYQQLAHETGTSFLLPMGITIGIIMTTYGAFFIGSHLKEFTERFGL